MRFRVMSKWEIQQHTFTEPCVVISIRSPRTSWAKIFGGGWVKDILRLRFSDSTPTEGFRFPKDNPEALQVDMSIDQARQIVAFVRKAKANGIDLVIAHCLGGVSRSRGVICALMTLDGQNPAHVALAGDPNPWCEALVLQAGRENAGSPEGGGSPEAVPLPEHDRG